MENPESILENETHKILCDFEMQTDHRIPDRQPHLVIINKKKMNMPTAGRCRPGGSQI